MIILLTLLLVYSGISGVRDAMLYSKKGAESFPYNTHRWVVKERITIFAITVFAIKLEALQGFKIADVVVLMVSWLLMFSFIHNGCYYQARKEIDNAYKGWFDDSTTSTAWMEMGIEQRSILFDLGLILITTYLWIG